VRLNGGTSAGSLLISTHQGVGGREFRKLSLELPSAACILSSGLGDPDLERKLLARIRLIDFGAEDVLVTLASYAIDFVPY